MTRPRLRSLPPTVWPVAGAVTGAVLVALVLWSRQGLRGTLDRDESIYVYAGQQLARGVPLYVSIFDPKGPGASTLAGIAVVVARVLGRSDVLTVRVAYAACAVLTVVAVGLLTGRLFGSPLAVLVSGVVFASFRGYALDAFSGPDAKVPGVLMGVLAMWMLVERRWLLAGVAAALASAVWQPFAAYPLAVLLYAVLAEPRGRRRVGVLRALLGMAVVLVAAIVEALAFGGLRAVRALFVSAVLFPLTGVIREPETALQHVTTVFSVIARYYTVSGVFLEVGFVALVALGAERVVRLRRAGLPVGSDPLLVPVVLTGVLELGYAFTDFQGYPDALAFLPYGALGLAGLVAAVDSRTRAPRSWIVVAGTTLAVLALLTGYSWAVFGRDGEIDRDRLTTQQAQGCAINRVAFGNGPVIALGNPVPLVVSHRRDPGSFVYLDSGVAEWKVDHLRHGVSEWARQVRRHHPSMVIIDSWTPSYVQSTLRHHLHRHRHHYLNRYLGPWLVMARRPVLDSAVRRGVLLTREPTQYPLRPDGQVFTRTQRCLSGVAGA